MTEQIIEHPILFTGEMVLKIYTCAKCGKISIPFPCEHCGSKDFVKTQTRRVIRPQPPNNELNVRLTSYYYGTATTWNPGSTIEQQIKCPYGSPGDQLWVRENFCYDYDPEEDWYCDFTDGVIHNIDAIPENKRTNEFILYQSTWDGPQLKWSPSIHIPRWASRLQLLVKEIRVDYVQNITRDEIIAEGTPNYGAFLCGYSEMNFISLWDSINKKRGFGWDLNPWVWIVVFKRIT